MLQEIDISNDKIKSVILMITALSCKTVFKQKFEKKNMNSNIVHINFLSQLKLIILADCERFPIIKFNEY